MSASAWVVLGVVVFGVVVAVMAQRSRRSGESFEHAFERVLNTDEHKEREANRRAGLVADAPEPAAPPGGETAEK